MKLSRESFSSLHPIIRKIVKRREERKGRKENRRTQEGKKRGE